MAIVELPVSYGDILGVNIYPLSPFDANIKDTLIFFSAEVEGHGPRKNTCEIDKTAVYLSEKSWVFHKFVRFLPGGTCSTIGPGVSGSAGLKNGWVYAVASTGRAFKAGVRPCDEDEPCEITPFSNYCKLNGDCLFDNRNIKTGSRMPLYASPSYILYDCVKAVPRCTKFEVEHRTCKKFDFFNDCQLAPRNP